jgi:hypothetical protein
MPAGVEAAYAVHLDWAISLEIDVLCVAFLKDMRVSVFRQRQELP